MRNLLHKTQALCVTRETHTGRGVVRLIKDATQRLQGGVSRFRVSAA